MRRGPYVIGFALLCAGAAGAQLTASRGEITVIVEGLRVDGGEVRVALFATEAGFPDNEALAFKSVSAEVKNYEARAVFTDIPYGTYAVYVFHDENANGVADVNFFKVPVEGFGASRNAGDALHAPEFDEAEFLLNSERLTIRIYMRY